MQALAPLWAGSPGTLALNLEGNVYSASWDAEINAPLALYTIAEQIDAQPDYTVSTDGRYLYLREDTGAVLILDLEIEQNEHSWEVSFSHNPVTA